MKIIYIEYMIMAKEQLLETKFKNGLQNVENRILAIKGTITFDTKSGKGFKSSILFLNNQRRYVQKY
jgi:hypothetical protein